MSISYGLSSHKCFGIVSQHLSGIPPVVLAGVMLAFSVVTGIGGNPWSETPKIGTRKIPDGRNFSSVHVLWDYLHAERNN